MLINHFQVPKWERKNVISSPKYNFNFVCLFFSSPIKEFLPETDRSKGYRTITARGRVTRSEKLDCIFLVDDWDSVEAAGLRYLMRGADHPFCIRRARKRNNGYYGVHDGKMLYDQPESIIYTHNIDSFTYTLATLVHVYRRTCSMSHSFWFLQKLYEEIQTKSNMWIRRFIYT